LFSNYIHDLRDIVLARRHSPWALPGKKSGKFSTSSLVEMKMQKALVEVSAAGSIFTPILAGGMLCVIKFLMICILFTLQDWSNAIDWVVAVSLIRA
jgi:hypothetical protein